MREPRGEDSHKKLANHSHVSKQGLPSRQTQPPPKPQVPDGPHEALWSYQRDGARSFGSQPQFSPRFHICFARQSAMK